MIDILVVPTFFGVFCATKIPIINLKMHITFFFIHCGLKGLYNSKYYLNILLSTYNKSVYSYVFNSEKIYLIRLDYISRMKPPKRVCTKFIHASIENSLFQSWALSRAFLQSLKTHRMIRILLINLGFTVINLFHSCFSEIESV